MSFFFFVFAKNHRCIDTLRDELDRANQELEKYKNEMDFYKNQVRTLQVESNLFDKILIMIHVYVKEFIRTIRLNNPTISCLCEQIENDEVLRYVETD